MWLDGSRPGRGRDAGWPAAAVNGDRCPGPGAGHGGRDAVPTLMVEELRAVAVGYLAARADDPASLQALLGDMAANLRQAKKHGPVHVGQDVG